MGLKIIPSGLKKLKDIYDAVIAMSAKLPATLGQKARSAALSVGLSTEDQATQDSIDTEITAINAKLVSGTDIGDVTINNASGGSAVNIQDGGNSITVDANNLDIRDLAHTQDSVKIGDGTDIADVIAVDGYNGLVAIAPGHQCTNNCSSTPLGGGATFTGTSEDVLNYGVIVVSVYTDQVSATDGLSIEFSTDETNWDHKDLYTIPASTAKTFSVQTSARYFRVRYTNGATPQTAFRLQTLIKPYYVKPSSHRIADAISGEDDAELTKAILTGENPGGSFVNFGATTAGNFKMSIEEFDSSVSTNTNELNVAPYCVNEDSTYSQLLGDVVFEGSLVTIPPEHHEIHCGDMYRAFRTVDVGNGANDDILIIVPDESVSGKRFHLVVEGICESEGEWFLYEGTTYSAAGTSITSYNAERDSANADTLGITYTPTVTGVGTRIDGMHVGSGRGTGGDGRTDEWVLANNTVYLLRFTNSTTSNNYITWRLKYYVHPGV